jgi:hypothetical protein
MARRTTPDGKPYCYVTDPNFTGEIEIHPDVYRLFLFMQQNNSTGRIDVWFEQGIGRRSKVLELDSRDVDIAVKAVASVRA